MADRPLNELNELSNEANRIYDSNLSDKPKGDQAAILFDLYQRWYDTLDDAVGKEVDITIGGIRIRAFGSDSQMQEAWNRDWRSKNPEWGPAAAGVNVSSPIPEVWVRLKKDAKGRLILPPHIQIHEIGHTQEKMDTRIQPQHEMIKNESYEPKKKEPAWWNPFQ